MYHYHAYLNVKILPYEEREKKKLNSSPLRDNVLPAYALGRSSGRSRWCL